MINRFEFEFRAAENRWGGCDWDTQWGSNKLNLKGLTARRTRLMANAISGVEAKAWSDAGDWLAQIEMAAAEAKSLAAQAVQQCQNANWAQALQLMEAACAIESKYHSTLVWQSLREAIQQLP
jgi:hypothetical protein